jgi:hypothetical protein
MLRSIADRMVANLGRKVATIYKQLDDDWSDASVHRIQAKWKVRKTELLPEAKARRDAALARRSAGVPRSRGIATGHEDLMPNVSRALRAQRDFLDLINGGSATRFARELDTATKAVRALRNNSAAEAMRQLDKTLHVTRELDEFQKRVDRMLGTYRFGMG